MLEAWLKQGISNRELKAYWLKKLGNCADTQRGISNRELKVIITGAYSTSVLKKHLK